MNMIKRLFKALQSIWYFRKVFKKRDNKVSVFAANILIYLSRKEMAELTIWLLSYHLDLTGFENVDLTDIKLKDIDLGNSMEEKK